MLMLHHLENSQSIRILWLFEELGLDYEIKHYDRDKVTQLAPVEFKRLHPFGTSPVLQDGDLILPESNAIIDYVIDNYGGGRLRPAIGSADYVPYLQWFHAAQGSLMPLLLQRFIFQQMQAKSPFLIKPIIGAVVKQVNNLFLGPRLDSLYGAIESQLDETKWMAGAQVSAADIVMGYCIILAAGRGGLTEDKYPNAHRFLAQMRARPAYKRALAANGPFNPLME